MTRPSIGRMTWESAYHAPVLAREVADAIPGARYEVVEKAGHFGYLEQPARVNELLLEFLGQH